MTKSIIYLVGLATILVFTNTQLQEKFNTVKNKLECKVQVNPTYLQKMKCSLVDGLTIVNEITKK